MESHGATISEILDSTSPGPAGGQLNGPQRLDQDSQGAIEGLFIPSCCPPDVQPNTRIVAVCGVTDITLPNEESPATTKDNISCISKAIKKMKVFTQKQRQECKDDRRIRQLRSGKAGLAAPRRDGWLFANFFLFHHLFRGLFPNQLWLTCEQPEDLVDRYDTYTHGDPSGDCRVVLDRQLLSILAQDGNICISKREELLEVVLAAIKSEAELAAAEKQPILLLIFGLGDIHSNGVALGSSDSPQGSAPRLFKSDIDKIVKDFGTSVALMLTDCDSRGWIYEPLYHGAAGSSSGSSKTEPSRASSTIANRAMP